MKETRTIDIAIRAALGATMVALAATILFFIVFLFVYEVPAPAPEGSYYPAPTVSGKD